MSVRNSDSGSTSCAAELAAGAPSGQRVERSVLEEPVFSRMIALERKRSERSSKAFLLMLVEVEPDRRLQAQTFERILDALSESSRETDLIGWHEENSILGIMFTELSLEGRAAVLKTLIARASAALRKDLSYEQLDRVRLSFHLFPDDWEESGGPRSRNHKRYPDLSVRDDKKSLRLIKRTMDVAGSLGALVFLSPIFLAAAAAVKLTSKGPVFYRQQRVGQFGVPFSLLKFRSMYDNSSTETHKEYVRQLIAGVADRHPGKGDGDGVYKLTSDSRITGIGGFLRRTSLDELPQLINVLKGEMSLVGPRPPIDYEVEQYELWHRRRLMEAKPGITGLWQVGGRNRVAFDDMVRLDLQYARTWSPWLDLKILLLTPKAVIEGAH